MPWFTFVPKKGTCYTVAVQIIALRVLRRFWEKHPQAEAPLRTWNATVSSGPADVRSQFGNTVDFVADNRVIFDIGGNKYRLIVRIAYRYKAVQIKFVGTHAEYDQIDPVTCEMT